MTIDDLANIQSGREKRNQGKYRRVINELGFEEVKACIPFSFEEIKMALREDQHLNNLSLRKWDKAAGFMQGCQGNMICIGSPLINLYHKAGVTSFSCSDGVCILKEAARIWVEGVTQK